MAKSALITVKRHAIGTPDRHRKGTPHRRWGRLVPVANRRDPRASRSALTSDGAARVGGACLPTGASRGGTQARCLKRQLSLPVSMDFAMMAQAVEERGCHLGIAEHGVMHQ